MRTPIYRDDVKGKVAAHISECVDCMAGNMRSADYFVIAPEDCDCFAEYAQYLTDAELMRAFKLAARRVWGK